MNRILIVAGLTLFTFEHPLFIALSSLIYFVSENITDTEKDMLKDFVSKGTDWLPKLNQASKDAGIKMNEGRSLASEYVSSIFSKFNPEQLKDILGNTVLQDRIAKTIQNDLNSEESEYPWENYVFYAGSEDDTDLEPEELDFIRYFAPNFDMAQIYTAKDHRQLFKLLKSKFRNPDGSIKNELGDEITTYLEGQVRYEFSREIPEGKLPSQEACDFVLNKEYKLLEV